MLEVGKSFGGKIGNGTTEGISCCTTQLLAVLRKATFPLEISQFPDAVGEILNLLRIPYQVPAK